MGSRFAARQGSGEGSEARRQQSELGVDLRLLVNRVTHIKQLTVSLANTDKHSGSNNRAKGFTGGERTDATLVKSALVERI
jgi:hypothetical protein